ncbi:MAG: hypothetical protein ACYCQJ_01760 [Nitrososphaerales archaeon]
MTDYQVSEYKFTTVDGHSIVIRANDKLRNSAESFPSHNKRSGLVFTVIAKTEIDESLVVNIISDQLGAVLGKGSVVVENDTVKWNGQSSLDSGQMMATIIKALEQQEGIIEQESMKAPWYANIISRVN